jgi:hypothetical protein
MGERRDREVREDWQDHPQSAFLAAQGAIFDTGAGAGPETPQQRAAREGAPEVEGPSLDELISEEEGPVVSDFARGALAAHQESEERAEGEEGSDRG